MTPSPENAAGPNAGSPGTDASDLLIALRQLMALMNYPVSEEALVAGQPITTKITEDQVVRVTRAHGFEARWQKRPLAQVSRLLLPCIVMRSEGRAAVVTAIDGTHVTALLPELGDEPVRLEREIFEAELTGRVLLLKPAGDRVSADDRSGIEDLIGPGHWFWRVVKHFRGYYYEAAIAALMVNVLALASVFFTMNVYDRVVSNQAYTTLWTLAIGVWVAMFFEYTMRNLRAWLLDNAGKKADLLLSSSLFARVLATRLEARPQSAGAFANQLREYESLRDFATSTVLVALSDLPFVLLFLGVLYVMSGPLVLVPALALPVLVIVALVVQAPLARNINQNMRESSLRHGVLIESIDGAETVKALRAEGRMLGKYEHSGAITALTANKTRLISNAVMNFHTTLTSLCTVIMVVWGVYLIGAGELTQGTLIGAVMLCSRTLAPLAAFNALAVRVQQARSSYRTLNDIMGRPTDREAGKTYAQRPVHVGNLAARDMKFAYGPQSPLVLRELNFDVPRGDKVAVIGRVGSGKTTLLKVLAGLYNATEGLVLMDGVDIRQIDPAEYRRGVLYVGQHAQLFYGTLRDNLKMGDPFASDESMMRAAAEVGVHSFAQLHPMGYDMIIGERGDNLSGGQRQAIALARALLVDADVLLLDEPTSAMDAGTETQALRALFQRAQAKKKTVILVTHKIPLLEYVQRVMVLDHGIRVADGPRDAVMQAMREGRLRKADPTAPALAQAGQRRPGKPGPAANSAPEQDEPPRTSETPEETS